MRRAADVLMILLGLGFLVAGGMKLNDPAAVRELFASWGVPHPAVIPIAGWVEVLLGLGLLNPPTRRLAAGALAAWMALWGALQLRAGSPAAIASGVVLLVTAWYAWAHEANWLPRRHVLASPLTETPPAWPGLLHDLLRLVGVAFLIRWAIGGVLYWCALPVLAWAQRDQGEEQARFLDRLLLHLLVLGLGVSGLWSFVGHTFLSAAVADSVGWAVSPFQRELAFYHLAIGMAGVACWWLRDHFWLAAAAIPSVFLLGAGWVHLTDRLAAANTAPANWGWSVLFGNLLLPMALLGISAVRARRVSHTKANTS